MRKPYTVFLHDHRRGELSQVAAERSFRSRGAALRWAEKLAVCREFELGNMPYVEVAKRVDGKWAPVALLNSGLVGAYGFVVERPRVRVGAAVSDVGREVVIGCPCCAATGSMDARAHIQEHAWNPEAQRAA